MKAVLLAGGTGTRLKPLTLWCNKHLAPVYSENEVKPVIEFAVDALRRAGVTDVAVVLGDVFCEDIFAYLKDGAQYNMNFTYFWQGRALGIAQAVWCAKAFWENESEFVVYLGDNVFERGVTDFINNAYYSAKRVGCLFAKVPDNKRFGVPQFDKAGKLVGVVEKPLVPPSNLALTGCYYFDSYFFAEYYKTLTQSNRGEYEITDLINAGLKHNEPYYQCVYDGWWIDVGTPLGVLKLQALLKT